jgi:predicted transcriptional regulator
MSCGLTIHEAQKRRDQNRIDQRKYRARKEQAIQSAINKLLESKYHLGQLLQHNSALNDERHRLEKRIAELEAENEALRSIGSPHSSYLSDDAPSVEDFEALYPSDPSDIETLFPSKKASGFVLLAGSGAQLFHADLGIPK